MSQVQLMSLFGVVIRGRNGNLYSLRYQVLMFESWMLAVCFWAILDIYLLIPFFKPKKTFFTTTNAIFNIIIYTHPFCTFNQKKPLKMGIQGPNLYIFLWCLKSEFLKKIFFKILNLRKSVRLKKWLLNLKQKIKPHSCNTHF